MWALVICIFVITFGRMIEIYLVTSIAPIPMATMVSREWGQTGQNYLRTLFALGFQAFMMILCVAIYTIFLPNRPIKSGTWYNVMGDERWQNHTRYPKVSCWK